MSYMILIVLLEIAMNISDTPTELYLAASTSQSVLPALKVDLGSIQSIQTRLFID